MLVFVYLSSELPVVRHNVGLLLATNWQSAK